MNSDFATFSMLYNERRDSCAPPPSGSDPQELGYGSRNSRAASTQSMADSDIPF